MLCRQTIHIRYQQPMFDGLWTDTNWTYASFEPTCCTVLGFSSILNSILIKTGSKLTRNERWLHFKTKRTSTQHQTRTARSTMTSQLTVAFFNGWEKCKRTLSFALPKSSSGAQAYTRHLSFCSRLFLETPRQRVSLQLRVRSRLPKVPQAPLHALHMDHAVKVTWGSQKKDPGVLRQIPVTQLSVSLSHSSMSEAKFAQSEACSYQLLSATYHRIYEQHPWWLCDVFRTQVGIHIGSFPACWCKLRKRCRTRWGSDTCTHRCQHNAFRWAGKQKRQLKWRQWRSFESYLEAEFAGAGERAPEVDTNRVGVAAGQRGCAAVIYAGSVGQPRQAGSAHASIRALKPKKRKKDEEDKRSIEA